MIEETQCQTPKLKSKQRNSSKVESSRPTKKAIIYTPEEFNASDEKETPKLLFVSDAALTATEMFSILCEWFFA